MKLATFCAAFALLFATPIHAQTTSVSGPETAKILTAPLINAKGKTIGAVTFTEGQHGVLIRVQVTAGKLTAGWHGMHIHEVGDCTDAMAGFKASGKHAGHMATVQHGLLNAGGFEPGDLPNLYVASRGSKAGAEVFSVLTTLGAPKDGRTPLLDADGSALIIHALPDDQTSQPIGGAGDRVACAAIKP